MTSLSQLRELILELKDRINIVKSITDNFIAQTTELKRLCRPVTEYGGSVLKSIRDLQALETPLLMYFQYFIKVTDEYMILLNGAIVNTRLHHKEHSRYIHVRGKESENHYYGKYELSCCCVHGIDFTCNELREQIRKRREVDELEDIVEKNSRFQDEIGNISNKIKAEFTSFVTHLLSLYGCSKLKVFLTSYRSETLSFYHGSKLYSMQHENCSNVHLSREQLKCFNGLNIFKLSMNNSAQPSASSGSKRRVIDVGDSDEEEDASIATKKVNKSSAFRISDAAPEIVASNSALLDGDDVSLDTIKLLHGVDPIVMRRTRDAFENEKSYVNPLEAYARLDTTTTTLLAAATVGANSSRYSVSGTKSSVYTSADVKEKQLTTNMPLFGTQHGAKGFANVRDYSKEQHHTSSNMLDIAYEVNNDNDNDDSVMRHPCTVPQPSISCHLTCTVHRPDGTTCTTRPFISWYDAANFPSASTPFRILLDLHDIFKVIYTQLLSQPPCTCVLPNKAQISLLSKDGSVDHIYCTDGVLDIEFLSTSLKIYVDDSKGALWIYRTVEMIKSSSIIKQNLVTSNGNNLIAMAPSLATQISSPTPYPTSTSPVIPFSYEFVKNVVQFIEESNINLDNSSKDICESGCVLDIVVECEDSLLQLLPLLSSYCQDTQKPFCVQFRRQIIDFKILLTCFRYCHTVNLISASTVLHGDLLNLTSQNGADFNVRVLKWSHVDICNFFRYVPNDICRQYWRNLLVYLVSESPRLEVIDIINCLDDLEEMELFCDSLLVGLCQRGGKNLCPLAEINFTSSDDSISSAIITTELYLQKDLTTVIHIYV